MRSGSADFPPSAHQPKRTLQPLSWCSGQAGCKVLWEGVSLAYHVPLVDVCTLRKQQLDTRQMSYTRCKPLNSEALASQEGVSVVALTVAGREEQRRVTTVVCLVQRSSLHQAKDSIRASYESSVFGLTCGDVRLPLPP